MKIPDWQVGLGWALLAAGAACSSGSVAPASPAVTTSPQAAATPAAGAAVEPVTGMPRGTDGRPWWNDTVFYEVFVRSFSDSNGDGVGDFKGLTAKLDYLNDGNPATKTDLGVTGIWLMPIQPAASYHGYDITDFFSVNPDYGTQADFEVFVAEAHKRGIRVILDLVLNHTSDQNEWFASSLQRDTPFRDWYVWSESPPNGASGWYPTTTNSGYYYAYFGKHMPDLNYRNPEVTARMRAVARHWLMDEHVDGFRIDAAKYLIEDGAVVENSDSTHAWYRDFRSFYRGLNPQALTVGEAWSQTVVASSYAQGDQLDMVFDFDLAQATILGAGLGNANQINTTLATDLRLFKPGQFASFLTNHDQVRVMSVLGGQVDKAKTAATLLLSGPGAPFIYYGEEIGMQGKKPDEDLRRPMQWSSAANAGFSTGQPWRDLNSDWRSDNVAAQTQADNSLLAHYRKLIDIRNQHAALRVGDTYVLDSGNRAVFACLRVSEGEVVLVLVNLGKTEVIDYGLTVVKSPLKGRYTAAAILGAGPLASLTVDGQGGLKSYKPLSSLTPFGSYIIQLAPGP